jgi:hypothetical protein
MYPLWLFVLICQTPQTKPDVFQHDSPYRFAVAFRESLPPFETQLRELTEHARYDEIADELKRRSADWSKDRAEQIVGMGQLLHIVAITPVLPESKGSVNGRADERIREICQPHVRALLTQDLSIPADANLVSAQVTTAINFAIFIPPKDLEKLKQSEQLRREALEPVIRVWGRLIRTCLVYKEAYPEEMMAAINSGDSRLPVPKLPKNFTKELFVYGQAPETIRDPQARKVYADHLKSAQDVRDRFQAAKTVSQLRGFALKTIRRQFEHLYGEDRKTWDELRQVVTDTIQDPDVAQLVIKDFTRRKEPGLWP